MESLAEWKERTRMNGAYKMGISMAITVVSAIVLAFENPADPDLGFTFLAWAGIALSAVLWFLGFWDFTRSKGRPGIEVLYGLLHVLGLAILANLPEGWCASPPRESKPPTADRAPQRIVARRYDW